MRSAQESLEMGSTLVWKVRLTSQTVQSQGPRGRSARLPNWLNSSKALNECSFLEKDIITNTIISIDIL